MPLESSKGVFAAHMFRASVFAAGAFRGVGRPIAPKFPQTGTFDRADTAGELSRAEVVGEFERAEVIGTLETN